MNQRPKNEFFRIFWSFGNIRELWLVMKPLLSLDRISQAILGKCPRSRNTRLKCPKVFFAQNPFNRSKLDNFLNLGPLARVNSSNQNFFDFETLLLGDSDRGMTLWMRNMSYLCHTGQLSYHTIHARF